MVNRRSSRNKERKTYEQNLITYWEPHSQISEQYRAIRTNIEFVDVDRTTKSIMVTSPSPNEGKSTTISNLAIVFAQQGKSVLLIDADLRKPSIHTIFQLNNVLGLTNTLAKKALPMDCVQLTNIRNLSVLTSGPIPPNPSELLSSNTMSILLKYLTSRYDIILFDTPPILAVTDAKILSNICDAYILVLSSGSTEIESAQQAISLLSNSNGKLLGAVLNNMKMKDSPYYYYGKS